MPAHEGLLAPSDIADLAGVSRAAVSNWRKRMSDFPEPAEGSASKPLFAAKDVEAWLTAHPDKRKPDNSADSSTRAWESRLWGVANLFRGHVDVHDFGGLVLRTAVEFLDGQPSLASRNVSQRSVDELRDALESIPREDLPAAIDGLLERTSRALGKAGGETGFVGSRTSTLLASLSADVDSGTLYDPACGIGVALLQALDLGATPDRLVGDEISATAAEITLGRAALRGVDLKLRITDVLRSDPDPDLRADVIIAEPPYGLRVDPETSLLDPRLRFGIPPRSSSDSYWLQHVVAHLAPSGVGYVLTSPGTLFRGGAEAKIRRNLLLGGWVRAVVALTGKMLPQTSIAPVLWVLGESKPSARGSVLLIDASKVDAPEGEVARWLADEASLADVPHARVPIDELAAGNADLSPARWMLAEEVDSARLVADFDRASARLLQASTDLPATVRHLEPPRIASEPPVLTVAALVEAGAIEVAPARPPRQGDPEFEDRRVDATAVRTRNLVQVTPIASDEHGPLTQPCDVLLTTVDKVRALVDDEGGHLPVGSIFRIRIVDRTKLDPHYLADVLAGEWNSRFAAGSGIQRIPVREIEIPVPSLPEQRAIHATIDRAREAKRLAKQAAEAADSLTTAILNAVRHSASLTSNTTEGTTQ
ncbi:N-6 DNA methylase [Microbacterium halotolerans]|uniref:N-6 DNA methylase n=1 Tax=Microbacterium halotolerans TaxID=246613 RepID=UPI000E6ACED0|nr:N-6 DNA methylase [Microbacterium halotolerans]